LQSLLRLLDLLTLSLLLDSVTGPVADGLELSQALLLGSFGGFDF
jgi:hypothetical protein